MNNIKKKLPLFILLIGIAIGVFISKVFLNPKALSKEDYFFFKKSGNVKNLETEPVSKNDAKKLNDRYLLTKHKYINNFLKDSTNYYQIFKDINGNDSLGKFKETEYLQTDITTLLIFLNTVAGPNVDNKAVNLKFTLGQYNKSEKYDSLKVDNNKKRYNGKLTFIMKAYDILKKQVGDDMDVMTLCPPDCN